MKCCALNNTEYFKLRTAIRDSRHSAKNQCVPHMLFLLKNEGVFLHNEMPNGPTLLICHYRYAVYLFLNKTGVYYILFKGITLDTTVALWQQHASTGKSAVPRKLRDRLPELLIFIQRFRKQRIAFVYTQK